MAYPVTTTRIGVVGAVQRHDVSKLKEILKENLLYGYEDLTKALHSAADKGYDECVRLLLEYKAMPDAHDAAGITALILAAIKGHTTICDLLIKAGCNINKASYRVRSTALHWAATNNHIECVSRLLEAGADIEVATVYGQTPLLLAARTGNIEIVDMLLSQGANVHARNRDQATALHLASEEGDEDCVAALIKAEAEVNAQTRTGDTPLLKAASRGHEDVLQLLMNHGADLTIKRYEMTALHLAAQGGHTDVIKVLLSVGMDVNSVTQDSYYSCDMAVNEGISPLMLATKYGHDEAVKVLIDSGATTDLVDEEGKSALVYAIKADNPGCVLRLLDGGTSPDGTIKRTNEGYSEVQGYSPLFVTLNNNNITILRILLRFNCNLEVLATVKGEVLVGPLEYSLMQRHLSAARMLLVAGINPWQVNTQVMEECIPWMLDVDEESCIWIMDLMRNPSSLMTTCRKKVRTLLGHKAGRITDSQLLPLPSKLLQYVNLEELDQI